MEKVKISLVSIARRPGPQVSQRAGGLAVAMGVPLIDKDFGDELELQCVMM